MEDKNKRIKLVLIGDQNTGKTKFTHYILNKSKIASFSDYQPTIGGSYCSKNITYNNKCYISTYMAQRKYSQNNFSFCFKFSKYYIKIY